MKKIIFMLLIILMSCKPYGFIGDDTVQMSQRNGMHFVQITLNGIKTNLLLDTGASKTILDVNKAEKFNFKCILLNENQYIGIGGKTDLYVVYNYKVDELFIPFLGTDLSEITEYFSDGDIEIVGILGSDFIERYKVIIDFHENIIYYKRK